MRSSIFWDIMPCDPLKVNQMFRRKILPPSAACCLLHFWLFSREDGNEMFLRNTGWLSTDYVALYPRRQKSSLICVVDISLCPECRAYGRNNGRFVPTSMRAVRAHNLQTFCYYSEASEVIKTGCCSRCSVALKSLVTLLRFLGSRAGCGSSERKPVQQASRLDAYQRSGKSAAAGSYGTVIVSGVPWVWDGRLGRANFPKFMVLKPPVVCEKNFKWSASIFKVKVFCLCISNIWFAWHNLYAVLAWI
jgi:hypothetical protein